MRYLIPLKQPSKISLLFTFALVASMVLAAGGCRRGGSHRTLEPVVESQPLDDLRVSGGGIVLHEIFEGAWVLPPGPEVRRVYPEPGSSEVGPGAPIALAFTESIDATKVVNPRIGLQREDGAFLDFEITWLLDQTLLVLSPLERLDENTSFQVLFRDGVTDLNGHSVAAFQFGFKTGSRNAFVQAVTLEASLGQGLAARNSAIVAIFDEPIRLGGGRGSADIPSNFRIEQGDQKIPGTYVSVANDNVVVFTPSIKYSPNRTIKAKLSSRIESDFGRALGNGPFAAEFQVIALTGPENLTLPETDPITRPIIADGTMLSETIRRFAVDVGFDSDDSDFFGLLYSDPRTSRGFRFEGNIDPWIADLEPSVNLPVLSDGEILVGAYLERDGIRSPVGSLKRVLKDTSSLSIEALGPLTKQKTDPTRFLTTLRKPALYGRVNQAGTLLTLRTANASFDAIPHVDAHPFVENQVTLDNDQELEDGINFFITEPAEIPFSADPTLIIGGDAEDTFKNSGPLDPSSGSIQLLGFVGAKSIESQGLYVIAHDARTLQPIAGADVILEAFPISNSSPKIAKSSPAQFDANDLESLGAPLVAVTVLRDGFDLVSYVGIRNPNLASPIAVSVALEPANNSSSQRVEVSFSSNDDVVRLASNTSRFNSPARAFTELAPAKSYSALAVFGAQPRFVTAFAEIQNEYRIAFARPSFIDKVKVEFDLDKAWHLNPTEDPSLRLLVQRDSADGSGVYDPNDPCAEGRCIDRIEARLIMKLPGIEKPLPIFVDTKLSRTGKNEFESEGILLFPSEFLTNEVPGPDHKGEDSSVELLMQPSLVGGGEPVDRRRLEETIWTEFVIGNEDGRASITRSPIDFTQMDRPVAIFENVEFLRVPFISAPSEQIHPPAISWIPSTQIEGLYVIRLIRPEAEIDPDSPSTGLFSRRWTVYLPRDVMGDPRFRYPDLRLVTGLQNNPSDFSEPYSGCGLPGCLGFGAEVEAYEFDLDIPNDPNDDDVVQFDAQAYSLSQLTRDMVKRSISDNRVTIRTRD